MGRGVPLHRRASVISGLEGDFLFGDAVELGIVRILLHHPREKSAHGDIALGRTLTHSKRCGPPSHGTLKFPCLREY